MAIGILGAEALRRHRVCFFIDNKTAALLLCGVIYFLSALSAFTAFGQYDSSKSFQPAIPNLIAAVFLAVRGTLLLIAITKVSFALNLTIVLLKLRDLFSCDIIYNYSFFFNFRLQQRKTNMMLSWVAVNSIFLVVLLVGAITSFAAIFFPNLTGDYKASFEIRSAVFLTSFYSTLTQVEIYERKFARKGQCPMKFATGLVHFDRFGCPSRH